MSNKKNRRPGHGKFGKLTDNAGNEYDFDKNTKNGIPPIQVDDEFYFRGLGSQAATVNRVRVVALVNRIGIFDLLNLPGQLPEVLNSIQVDLRRIEVVQMIEKPKAEPTPEPTPDTAKPEEPAVPDTAQHLTAEELAKAKSAQETLEKVNDEFTASVEQQAAGKGEDTQKPFVNEGEHGPGASAEDTPATDKAGNP